MKEICHPLLGDTLYSDTHPSGLRVLVWPMPSACSVYAVFATRYGSVYNTLPTADNGSETVPEGIAHYLEHKLFESEDDICFALFDDGRSNLFAASNISYNGAASLAHTVNL